MDTINKILLALVVLFPACVGEDKQKEEIQEYDLLTIEPQMYEVEVEYAAQIKGKQDIRIIPRVEGYLEQILVKEGAKVKKGQLLFVIDQIQYQSAVRSAEANKLQAETLAAKAQQDFEGKQILREKNVVSDFDLQQAKCDLEVANANVVAAQAALEIAQSNLGYSELRSPSDGVIGRLPYRKGDFIGPSTTEGLTVVSDNSQMYIYFSMTENKVLECLGEYTSMQEAIAQMPELDLLLPNDKRYAEKGKIESISGIVDSQTGSVSVRAAFPNASGHLLSGGTAKVIMPHIYKDVIVIPQESTFEIQDKIYVYKVAGNKATSAMIEVQRLHDGKTFIVNQGLNAGDTIIARGAGLVREGTVVKR